MTYQQLLNEAAALVERAAGLMDDKAESCPHCGGHIHSNRYEYQQSRGLRETAERLRQHGTHQSYKNRPEPNEFPLCKKIYSE